MSKKPLITIEDGCLKSTLNLVQPFTDENMVEKYTDMQALIDMAVRSDDEDPNACDESAQNAE